MSTLKKFEDLDVWKDSIALSKEIYLQTQQANFNQDESLRQQIRSSSVAISTSIAEGFDYQESAKFLEALKLSKIQCGETRSLIALLLEIQFIDNTIYQGLYEKAHLLCQKINGLITYLEDGIANEQ